MMDARRLAYLDAMGIDVWVPRSEKGAVATGAQARIQLGEGRGDLLCIAPDPRQAGLKLAADISRAMRSPPVWAWPSSGDDVAGDTDIESAVAEGLFTRILVFGREAAELLFGPDCPEVVSTARVHIVPGLDRLGSDREAKRALWSLMLEEGIAAAKGGGAQ